MLTTVLKMLKMLIVVNHCVTGDLLEAQVVRDTLAGDGLHDGGAGYGGAVLHSRPGYQLWWRYSWLA